MGGSPAPIRSGKGTRKIEVTFERRRWVEKLPSSLPWWREKNTCPSGDKPAWAASRTAAP